MNAIQINTADGYPITATYFEPAQKNKKTIVISTGVGLPQRFFFNFAKWLASKGYDAYTFDYRGIGLSKSKRLKGMKASYYDWTNHDFTSVTAYAKKMHPSNTLLHVGHSFGGNSLGMSTAFQHYDKFLTIGSQYGYYKNFPAKMQWIILLGFGGLVPLLNSILGYFPSNWIGLGEPLPKQIAADWGTLLLNKESMLSLANKYKENHYKKLTQPMLLVSIDDDNFAPKKSVDVLAEKVFFNAKVERLHIVPKNYHIRKLGHNDFFRKRHKELLWPIVTTWFETSTKNIKV